MEDKKGVKKYLKKWFPKNPLSYLGWLGFLGVFGLLFFVPNMVPFALSQSAFSPTAIRSRMNCSGTTSGKREREPFAAASCSTSSAFCF